MPGTKICAILKAAAVLFQSRASEAALSPFGLIENLDLLPFNVLVTGDYHLGDTLSGLDHEGLVRKIHKKRPEFPAIVRIHSAGRIEHSDTVLHSQAAAWSHLTLKALRQSNIQACRYKHTLERLQ